ncbi:MAG: hypothetical protein ACK56F_32580, partial [bacterium]
MAQGARDFRGTGLRAFARHLDEVQSILAAARPTAVDPVNALREVRKALSKGRTVAEQQDLALEAAQRFADRNVEECRAIGRVGARLLRAGLTVLPPCPAGGRAGGDSGPARAPG